MKKYLGDAEFWRTLGKIALPIALQNLLSSSFALVDTLMVGQLGDIPLSAVGMAGQFGWFLSMILFGLVSGMTMFASQFWGAKDILSIRKVYGIALVIGCSVAAVFMVVGATIPDSVMLIFNRDEDVVRMGAEYLSVVAFSYLPIALNLVLMSVLRSTERVKLPLYTTLATTLINCGLNYIFIFGAFGIPAYGTRGAAIATVISSWMSPLIILVVSAIQKNILIAPPKDMFAFNRVFFASFIARALPVIFNESIWGCGTLIYNIVFANMGAENYAAVTILRTFESIAFVFFVGLCNASSVIIAKSIGSGDIEASIRDSRRFFVLVPLIGLFVSCFIVVFRSQIVGIFDMSGNISNATLDTAVTILCIYACELPFRNIPYILICGVFRPGGETKKGMKYDILFQWTIAIPVTLLTAFVFKLPFVVVFALMYVSEDWLKSVFCIKFYLSQKWIQPVTTEGKKGLELYKKLKAL